MTLKLRVETELDERSSTSAANKAQQEWEDASRNVSRAWQQNVDNGLRGVSTAFSRTARDASESFKSTLNSGINDAIGGAVGQFGTLGRVAESTFAGMSTKATVAAAGIGAIAVAGIAVTRELYNLGATWDDVGDSITAKTGIMGDQLEAMKSTILDVGRQSTLSFQDLAGISASVAQSFGATGTAAQPMIDQLSKLQELTGQGTDIRGLGRTFQLFDVQDMQRQLETLNQLKTVSDETGVSVNDLISQVLNTGKATKQFGLDIQDTTGMVAAFNEAGLDSNRLLPSMTIALTNFAKAGRDPADALRETLTQIQALGDSPAAAKLAQQTFGRGYIDWLNAVQDTNVVDELNNTNTALNNTGANHAIDDQAKATRDWKESLTQLKHTLEADVMPAAEKTFSFISDSITHVIWATDQLNDKLGKALGRINDVVNGPALDPSANFGHPPPAGPLRPGAIAPSPPPGLGGGALGGLLPGNTTGTFWGYQPPDTSKAPKGPRLGEAPSLPYDTTLPPGAANLPQTSAIVAAENSYLDARHALAEKQARLQQLEQDANATANDIQKAKNDVLNAQQAQQQAELRLADTAQNLYEQQNKQLNKYATDMGDIGAKLDKDFGISKGLAGVAENLFKFLADLAFAPALGAMRGAQAGLGYSPQYGGQGLIGIAAAQGAFGPQFTPAAGAGLAPGSASSAAGGLQAVLGPGGTVSMAAPSAAGAGYAGDASLLGNVPAGSYSLPGSGAWDLTKGLGDCSSAVEDLVNIMDGRSTAGRSMSTGNEADWLTAHGFLPGMGGPGDFRVGFNSGHTQATLPGGTPFNWGSDAAAARGGVGGTGADDPAFTSHYYRPAGGAGSAPAGPAGSTPGGLPLPLPVTVVGGAGGVPPVGGGATGVPAPGTPGAAAPSTTTGSGGVGTPPGLTVTGQPALGGPTFGGNTNPALTPGGAAVGPAPTPTAGPTAAPGLFGPGGPLSALPPSAGPAGPLPTHGFGGTGMPFGLGPPGIGGAGSETIGEGGIGGGLGTTLIGGMAPPQGTGKGGININSGILGAAAGAGAAGANMFAPGAGAAIQIGIQEAARAIQYGSQVAGIAVSGLQETFGFGKNSELAQSGWGQKILGGLVGAGVMLPNVAGDAAAGKAKGLTPDQQAQQKAGEKGGQQLTPEQLAEQKKQDGKGGIGQSAGQGNPVTNHFNIDASNRDADGAAIGRHAAWYVGQQQEQYVPAAMP